MKSSTRTMLPDAGVDQQISLTGRLNARAQSLHDLIGLDDAILQQTERVNRDSIYAIYDGELPEQGDALDSIAAAQGANALLNRVRREGPERHTRRRRLHRLGGGNDADTDGKRRRQAGFPRCRRLDRASFVLRRSGATGAVPTRRSGGGARHQPPRQRRPNRRRPETAPTPPEPPKRITANVRCIARELGQLRLGRRAADDLRRTERLRAAFAGELPAFVNARIGQLRRDGVSGTALSEALAELETQLAPSNSPPANTTPAIAAPGRVRVVGSMSVT